MASKFELSIDVNYVKSWGIVEAVREFFQNSYDEEKQNPNNKSYFMYDSDNNRIIIGNKLSILKSETLLLGCTSKDNDSSTIGQFGEGYKIATVVALRTGHNVTIYNYGAREVWTTRLVKSRKYNGRLVPTFFINKQFDWKLFFNNKEEKNLYIEIDNITEDEYNDIIKSNLNLQNIESSSMIKTTRGFILTDKDKIGNVYVEGLYVYHDPSIHFGYNIYSNYLKLDRDRMAVSSFDLQWNTSSMIINAVLCNRITMDLFVSMLQNNFVDVSYSNSVFNYINDSTILNKEGFIEKLYSDFIKRYGNGLVPVKSEEMRRNLNLDKNKSIILSSTYYDLLSRYSGPNSVIVEEKSLYHRIRELLMSNNIRESMTEEQIKESDNILDMLRYRL